MAIESAADRAALLSSDDFGVVVTKGADTFDAHFDKEYVEIGEMSGFFPVIIVTDEDVTTYSLASEDAISIGGVSYKIKVPQPDGTGFTRFVLEDQS